MKDTLIYNWRALLKAHIFKAKVNLLVWIGAISLFIIGVGGAYPALFSDSEELIGLVNAMKNPVMVAMFGPVFEIDPPQLAAIFSNQMLLLNMIMVAIMSIFVTAKMTRGDEEEGMLESLLALPVGRLSNAVCVMFIVTGMNLIIGGLVGVGLPFISNESFTFSGTFIFGFALSSTGILFSAITLLFAQIFESNRSVMALSFITLGTMYLLRGGFDVAESVLTLIIPLSWPLYAKPFIENNGILNILTIGFAFAIILGALRLNYKRDLHAGYIKPRRGKAEASMVLKTHPGFILKLLTPTILAWLITLFILGVSYGSIFGDLDTFIENNEIFKAMFLSGEYALNVQFMSIIMMVIAIVSGIGPIMMINHLAGEEKRNHTDILYSGNLSRQKNLGLYALFAVIGSIVFLCFGILGMLSGVMFSMDDPIETYLIVQAGIVYLPASLLMVSLSILLVGISPQKMYLIWIYLGYSFFVVYIGNIINLPSFLQWGSPYGHISQLPVEPYNILSSMLLMVFAFMFTMIGVKAYKTRDILG